MNEKLLQFIWQFQYFNCQKLITTQGEDLQIEKPGIWNHHQGPDFSEAIIRIGNTKWVGNVELHLRSSDWIKHQHSSDQRYTNIILHVVWEDDQPLVDQHGNFVSTIVLQPLIPKVLLERYLQMMQTMVTIPCYSFLPAISELAWLSWKERLVAERLERKSGYILSQLQHSNNHWEEVFWNLLSSNFGVKVNSELFAQVAKSISLAIIARHKNQVQQLEALLLGQANLLSGKYEDDYAVMLQKEYRYLRKKYGLHTLHKQPAFLRMRPAGFPTIRLAQLAMLLHMRSGIFSRIKEINDLHKVQELFMVTANDYWHYHYRFDEATPFQPKHLGKGMAENILINTIIPVLFAYGLYSKEESFKNKAVQWLYQLPAEQNQIIKQWQKMGVSNNSALDSQALIELTNHYCTNKCCLDCAVGNKILKNDVLVRERES